MCFIRRTGRSRRRLSSRWRPRGRCAGWSLARWLRSGTSWCWGTRTTCSSRPGPDRIADAGGLHGFMGWDRALITDSGWVSGLLAGAWWCCRRGEGEGTPGWRSRVGGLDWRGGRALPVLQGRAVAVHLARGLDGGAGEAGVRHRPRLRRVHAVPRRSGLHGAVDGADAPLAGTLPRVARGARAGAAGRVRDRPGRASTRTCGASRRRRSPRPASTGSRSAGRWAATRRRCAACSS